MDAYDFYEKVARNHVVNDFLDSRTISRKIELYAQMRGINSMVGRDVDVAEEILREGIDDGIRAYLFDICDPYVMPTAADTMRHLSNKSKFSEYLYEMILADDLIQAPLVNVTSENYLDALIKISELSGIVASEFHGFIHREYMAPLQSKRLF